MDVDWCLSCDKHLDIPGPYCSPACERDYHNNNDSDDDLDAIYHTIRDTTTTLPGRITTWPDRITAWAANVPAGPPPDSSVAESSSYRPPPRLVSERRPIPPSLSMSRPTQSACPSYPHRTPQQQIAALSVYSDLQASSATESSVATPPIITNHHKPSVFSTLASQVRSLVAPPKPHRHDLTSSLHFRSSSYSSQGSFEVDDDDGDVADGLWWMTTDSDSYPTVKKSHAQSITKAKDTHSPHNYFQPRQLPIPPSHSSQCSANAEIPAYRPRGRKL